MIIEPRTLDTVLVKLIPLLPWESWTTCSAPLCGGQGWISRKRRCRVPVNETTGLGKCSGNTLELRPCKTG
ncbi:unnamed protein product [Trichobilharzia regenti]|nr:unnamed protein product [Trichobilharzia regenti]